MNETVKRKPGRPKKIVENIPSTEYSPGMTDLMVTPESIKIPALRVHIYPTFGVEDHGDGGIRRVVEGMAAHLPKFGIEIVDTAEEADVIAYHATVAPPYINLYPRKAFVAICHGLYWSEYDWGNWAIKANEDVMEGLRVSDRITTCSEWVANSIRRHTNRRVDVVPHGIDVLAWEPKDNLGYVLWNKTRPDPICDPEPMNQLARAMQDLQFITSFGDEGPNVKITGRLDFAIAKELIERAGIYLCTTRETFGIGTIEAMACGVPVVGFKFGGQAEFIDHMVDGWLSAPGDITELANGVRWALENREAVGKAAKAKAEQFTWDRACEQYSRIFYEAWESKNQLEPRTSIIVTNYNLGRYLRDCLDSVSAQTDRNWECIIVDDASTEEDGRGIAREYVKRDDRFRLVANKTNVYLAEARNIGIRIARGRYILPLDADDMLAPDAVHILAESLDDNRRISVAYGAVKFVDEDGVTPTQYNEGGTPGHSGWPWKFEFERQIQMMNQLPYSSMFRREAWEQTGGYRRRCRTAEDADMWTRLSSYGFRPQMVTDADCLIYRNRPNSMSREQGATDWVRWFSWSKLPSLTPAGAGTKTQLPVPSLDPIIISVVIPLGPGHERFVLDAIDSVDAQSFKSWECIVINDTGKPLEIELPSWVRLLQTSGKVGPAQARNTGIKASKGALFLPLDADDYLEPDALHMMYEAYKETRAVIYTDFYQTGHDGKGITVHHCDDYDPHLITGKSRMVEGVIREGMIHAVTALTPKASWERVGGYDESLPAWEDWDFQISLGNIGMCSYRVPLPLFVYRKHTGTRREDNYLSFEKSKEGILRKWGQLWEGGKELMACSSCSARARAAVVPQSLLNQAVKQNDDAILIRYSGPKAGGISYRGQSRTVYQFSTGEEKYVLQQDAGMFLQYEGFEVVQAMPEVSQTPVLVADGQPEPSN